MATHIKTAPRVLIVVTSTREMSPGGEPTGVWLEELAVPYIALHEAGAKIDIVSTRGGELPIDPRSLMPRGENPPGVERFLDDADAKRALSASGKLADADRSAYDAVFFPGGHGTMWDLPSDPDVGAIIAEFLAQEKPVAAVCHGPAALVGARFADGTPVVTGRTVSTFTDSEERAAGLADTVPFALETRLRELGAEVKTGPDFAPLALRDGWLITGQNPASAEPVAGLLLQALAEDNRQSA